jgi:hypothetical protein
VVFGQHVNRVLIFVGFPSEVFWRAKFTTVTPPRTEEVVNIFIGKLQIFLQNSFKGLVRGMSKCRGTAFSTPLWSVNCNYIPNVIGQQAYWFIVKIRIRLAADGAPVAVKRRAVNRWTKVRASL